MSESLGALRTEREIMRDWIDNGGSWQPAVAKEAEAMFDNAVQRLADLSLTEDEIKEWFAESLFRVEWEGE